jgi:ankyrin repeat protein
LHIAERLLAAKAEVNATSTLIDGRTALQAASRGGHLEVVERLLAARADVNARSEARNGHLEVVKRLKSAGAR